MEPALSSDALKTDWQFGQQNRIDMIKSSSSSRTQVESLEIPCYCEAFRNSTPVRRPGHYRWFFNRRPDRGVRAVLQPAGDHEVLVCHLHRTCQPKFREPRALLVSIGGPW